MATKSKTANVDLNSVFEGAASQFRGLNPNEPGQWPLLPKALTLVAVAIADGRRRLVRAAVDAPTTSSTPSATRSRRSRTTTAPSWRRPSTSRAAQAEAAGRGVRHPAREAAAGQGRDGRAAVRHQPGRARPRPAVRAVQARARSRSRTSTPSCRSRSSVAGRYHDIGAFAADIANLSRIVTLHNLNITTPARTAPACSRWRRRRAPIATSIDRDRGDRKTAAAAPRRRPRGKQ